MAAAVLILALALAGCEDDAPTPSVRQVPAPTATLPGSSAGTTLTDLAPIACATDDPSDVGHLTGAWRGSEGGIYYIRHVGDCVWWFGTEIPVIEPGMTGQQGFANVASGRIVGSRIDVEWADLPLGDILGGGGLTLVYDDGNDQLLVTEQRGDWEDFGAFTFTRIDPNPSPAMSPPTSPSP